eukprot:jgi/Picre1/29253/NNA_004645.t1
MIDMVSQDAGYLTEVLENAAQEDAAFTGELMRIYKDTRQQKQPEEEISLVITRSDYMLHDPTSTMLQWNSTRLHLPLAVYQRWSVNCIVLQEDGSLMIDGTTVSLAYFRAGYTPTDYPSRKEWDARTIIEMSNAAKCPTIAMQLAGSKKRKQGLGALILMQRIIPPPHTVTMIRRGVAQDIESLSELGIYGVLLRKGSNVLVNYRAGQLVRTKASTYPKEA